MRLSILKRLALGFGVSVFIVLIFGILILANLRNNRKISEDIINIYTPSRTLVDQYYTLVDNSTMLIKSWVFIDKISDTPDKLRLKEIHEKSFPTIVSQINQLEDKWDDADRQLFDKVTVIIKDSLFVQHYEIMSALKSLESYDDPAVIFEIQPLVEEGGGNIELSNRILDQLTLLRKSLNKRATDSNIEVVNSYSSFEKFTVFMLLILVVASVFAAVVTTRSIILPIRKLNSVLLTMSEGELPEDKLYETDDELGQMAGALNNLIAELRKIITEIKNSAIVLTQLSGILSEKTSQIAEGANEQASSVEEVSASIEEIFANIEQNTENANNASSIVKGAVTKINNNNEHVEKTVHALQQISEKVNVINEIAFQTNILSLNAAVEAARAGQFGKGFGVVASEVGKLAEQSKISSNSIESLSKSSIEIAQKTQSYSRELVPEIVKTEMLIRQVSDAGMDLNAGVREISNAVAQLNKVAQQNASFADDIANSSSQLAQQSEKLLTGVSFFKLSAD